MHWLRLTNVIVLIHVLVGATLVLFILLHAGRGGGLSDMFGGGMGGGLSGSSAVERNLDRFTVVLSLIFGLTTVPSRRHFARCLIQATLKDVAYVAHREPDFGTKVRLMARVNHGRAFFASPREIGAYVLLDYVSNKRRAVS